MSWRTRRWQAVSRRSIEQKRRCLQSGLRSEQCREEMLGGSAGAQLAHRSVVLWEWNRQGVKVREDVGRRLQHLFH